MTRKEILQFGKEIADRIFHGHRKTETIKGWVTRNALNQLVLYTVKPIKGDMVWFSMDRRTIRITEPMLGKANPFPSVKWEDEEPTPCTITIEIEK